MITKHNLKNQIIVLSDNVTETDFEDSFIMVRAGSNIIGCKFKNCKIFIEPVTEIGSKNKQIKFTGSHMGRKEDIMMLTSSVDTFLKEYVD